MNLPNALPRPPDELRRLEAVWESPQGWRAITDVNNTRIGLLYLGTALVFLVLGGLLGLVMRAQLAVPGNTVIGPDTYNQVFTMHGSVMMFLFAVPVVEAMGVYLLPGMLGARDLPFPRLNAYAFWAYAIGGLAFFASLFAGRAPDGGWFMYPPLTSGRFSPGVGADFWLLGIGFIEISAIAGAIELIVGILRTRAPGMSLEKLPLYAWAWLAIGGDDCVRIHDAFHGHAALGTGSRPRARGSSTIRKGATICSGSIFLVLRPSRGVHHFSAGDRHGFDDRGHHGPDAARRLSVGRGRDPRHGRAQLCPLGPPHVCGLELFVETMHVFSRVSLVIVIVEVSCIQVFARFGHRLRRGRARLATPDAVPARLLLHLYDRRVRQRRRRRAIPFDRKANDLHFVVAHLHDALIGGMLFPLFAGVDVCAPTASGPAAVGSPAPSGERSAVHRRPRHLPAHAPHPVCSVCHAAVT